VCRLLTLIFPKGEKADFCTSKVQKYKEVLRSIKKYQEVLRSTKKYQEIQRSTEKYEEVQRSTEKYKEVKKKYTLFLRFLIHKQSESVLLLRNPKKFIHNNEQKCSTFWNRSLLVLRNNKRSLLCFGNRSTKKYEEVQRSTEKYKKV